MRPIGPTLATRVSSASLGHQGGQVAQSRPPWTASVCLDHQVARIPTVSSGGLYRTVSEGISLSILKILVVYLLWGWIVWKINRCLCTAPSWSVGTYIPIPILTEASWYQISKAWYLSTTEDAVIGKIYSIPVVLHWSHSANESFAVVRWCTKHSFVPIFKKNLKDSDTIYLDFLIGKFSVCRKQCFSLKTRRLGGPKIPLLVELITSCRWPEDNNKWLANSMPTVGSRNALVYRDPIRMPNSLWSLD
jgi:hypothetical protein